MDLVMLALLQLKRIKNKDSIISKLDDYEILGSFNSISEIEQKFKNYYLHKYRLSQYGWCYFVKKTNSISPDFDYTLLADKVVINLNYKFDHVFIVYGYFEYCK
jgi:hypothetical protein